MAEFPAVLSRESLHEIWKPDDLPWSPWVKSVPFSFWPRQLREGLGRLPPQVTVALFPPAQENCALVIDLPGAGSIYCGALLASLGYQPVPVMASCPLPAEYQGMYLCAVDVDGIITALVETAPLISEAKLPVSAPPAFLLDATRQAPRVVQMDNGFDNRSAIFSSDFPTATTLLAHGITRVLVVRDSAWDPWPDLGYALNPWRLGGISVQAVSLSGNPIALTFPPSGWFGRTLHWLKVMLTFRKNITGGFGNFASDSSGG